MDLKDVPDLLREYRDLAATAAPDAVMGMSKAYYDQVQKNLRLRAHPVGYFVPPSIWTNAPRGEPPALVTGRLAASVAIKRGATTGTYAQASVAPHTIYARTQEVGETHYGHPFMVWRDDGGIHYARKVKIPARPYMRPATEYTVTTGVLTRAAERAFKEHMKGLAGT